MRKSLPRAPLEHDTGPAIRFPHQARFEPLAYLAAMARAIKEQGGKIYGHSHADRVEGGKTARIEVGDHSVAADAVVVATNSPINDLVALHTKQAPYMTYAIGARVPRGSVEDALYWDTLEAYHYVRLQEVEAEDGEQSAYDLLIVGGEDHKTGQADDAHRRHSRLEAWARAEFPMIEKIEFKWGGQCMETIDGLAFIGRNPLDKENVYVVTGDSGMGITHGTIAGMLLTDLICGRENPWAELYNPAAEVVGRGRQFSAREHQRRHEICRMAHARRGRLGRRNHARQRRDRATRANESGGLSQSQQRLSGTLCRLSASGLHRALEPGRDHLGLPLPRLAV